MGNYHLKAQCDWDKSSTRVIVTPSMTAKTMFYYALEVGHLFTLPQYYTERENLNSYLIVYTAGGEGRLKYQGKKYTLNRGQAFFIDCCEYQYYETDSENLWNLKFLHFHGGASRSYYEQFIKGGSPVISLHEDTSLPDCLDQLITLHQNKNVRTEVISCKLIVEMLTEMLIESLKTGQVLQPGFLPKYIVNTVDYLEKNYHDKITLDQLALEFSVSKFHLSKTFKKYIGLTPYEYLFNTRINVAKDFLKYSDHAVSEIAQHIGFDHTSHFIRLFKQQEQMTPLSFRKEWQKTR
jgi:AraC-like DNA-binding protein